MQEKVNEDARFNIMKQSSLRELLEINSKKRLGHISENDAELMSQVIIGTLELQENLPEELIFANEY